MRSKEKHRRFSVKTSVAICTAVVILVTGGSVTAVARSGGLAEFFQSLFVTESLKTTEVTEEMEQRISVPEVTFSCTSGENIFTLLGMYGDDNQVMLSFSIASTASTQLLESYSVYTIMTLTDESGNVQIPASSGQCYEIRQSEIDEDVFYLNVYLNASDIDGNRIEFQGKTLHLDFLNFYSDAQVEAVQARIITAENELKAQFVAETYTDDEDIQDQILTGDTLPDFFDVDEWKKYYNAHTTAEEWLSLRTQYYAESDCCVSGSWNGDVMLDFSGWDTVTYDYVQGNITINSLSAAITFPAELDTDTSNVSFVLVMSDGTKIDGFAGYDLYNLNFGTENTNYLESTDEHTLISEDEMTETRFICFSAYICPADVIEIHMITESFDPDGELDGIRLDDGYTVTTDEIIYQQ